MVIGIILITLIILKIKEGNLSNLWDFNFKSLKFYGLIELGVILLLGENIILSLFRNEIIIINLYKYVHILSLLLIAIALAFNYKNFGFLLISIGFFLNLIPIILNGKMPVSYNALEKTLENNSTKMVLNHAKLLEMNASLSHGIFVKPKAEFLSDIIPITFPHFLAKVISIGDIVITIGIVVAIIYISKEK